MKTLPFAVVALVLTLTCGDTTSALNFNSHISDYQSDSNAEALSTDPFVFQDPQAPLTNDDSIKEVRIICVFRGEKAELQLDNPRPVFRIAGIGVSARDVYIVAMRLNPDRRDLEMGRSGLIKKLSYGFRKRDVRDVMVKRLGDDLLEVTPKENLEPGEYIIVLGGVAVPLTSPVQRSGSRTTGMPTATQGATGYDFGIIVSTKVASNN